MAHFTNSSGPQSVSSSVAGATSEPPASRIQVESPPNQACRPVNPGQSGLAARRGFVLGTNWETTPWDDWQALYHLPGLDYGNALLAKLSYTTIAPLQCVLNAAVILLYGLRLRDHVSAAAIELHWLPVEARIQFKLCLLVHLAVIGNAPTYMTDLLQSVSSLTSRETVLRSATRSDFQVPRTLNKNAGSLESAPSALQLQSRGTTCHCMST